MSDRTLGKYELLGELSRGGMADVFLAIGKGPAGLGFSKLVVIKRLRSDLSGDEDFVTMLVDEARIAARLNHPNVVQTLEIDNAAGEYFLAMEYLDGQSMRRILSRAQHPLPTPMYYAILIDVLAGLHHAHELKDFDGTPLAVVHRDVTPHNVFVTYDGAVKVLDFGIAKAVGRASETRHGFIKGKAPYMAPEQARGEPVDRRADLYSVGVMLWEATARRRMWKGTPDPNVLARLVRGDIPRSPRQVNPEVPAPMDAICQKALAFDPADRYENAEEFGGVLREYLATTGGRPETRDIGRFVSDAFAAVRTETSRVINERLARLRAESPETFRTLPLADLQLESRHSSTKTPSSQSSDRQGGVALAVQAAVRDGAPSELPTASALVPEVVISTRKPVTRLWVRGGLALVAAGFCTWGLFAATHGSPRTLVGPAASVPSSSPPPRASVNVVLRASPPETHFIFDGRPLEGNPFSGQFSRDTATHEVKAVAPGYVTRAEVVRLSEDCALQISLARSANPPGPATGSRR